MKAIKVYFCGFSNSSYNDYENNFIYKILNERYEVVIDKNQPDFLFFSVFDKEYLNYLTHSCAKVFYTSENMRANFNIANYNITFDYNENMNHYRFPFWHLRLSPEFLLKKHNEVEINQIFNSKTKFCSFIVSNPNSRKRIKMFDLLNRYKRVDSAGIVRNNIGKILHGGVYEKLDYMMPYKFSLCFENSSYPGYTTEKIYHALYTNAIPLYWGDPLIHKEINTKRIIRLEDFKNEKEFLQYVIEVDNNDKLYKEIIRQPMLIGDKLPEYCNVNLFKNYIYNIIEENEKFKNTILQKILHYPLNVNNIFLFKRKFGI